jgi:hypothetical protein
LKKPLHGKPELLESKGKETAMIELTPQQREESSARRSSSRRTDFIG